MQAWGAQRNFEPQGLVSRRQNAAHIRPRRGADTLATALAQSRRAYTMNVREMGVVDTVDGGVRPRRLVAAHTALPVSKACPWVVMSTTGAQPRMQRVSAAPSM